jgi:polyhydroxybutyrate depolymerase
MKRGLAALALMAFANGAQADCGPAQGPCELPDGEYHVALPKAPVKAPVLVFLHGAGGSGETAMRNTGLVSRFIDKGYAVITPTGSRKFRNSSGYVWSFFPGRRSRDEAGFLKRVVADAEQKFGVDSQMVLLSGFSAGAFMVSYLACEAPQTFKAYAPIAGGFWRPHPEACAGPVKLFQTHGWRDSTVPLEGRKLGGGQFQQGDIFAGLEIWRLANGCDDHKPQRFSETGQFWRRTWTACAPESALEMALYPGGHGVPKGWADMAMDWFENVVPRS